ncbi:hypothetical protein J2X97_001958 [Epilithonimonas hungarica]|nr:hypothetical protein [Epilithonimonas hungarica]
MIKKIKRLATSHLVLKLEFAQTLKNIGFVKVFKK